MLNGLRSREKRVVMAVVERRVRTIMKAAVRKVNSLNVVLVAVGKLFSVSCVLERFFISLLVFRWEAIRLHARKLATTSWLFWHFLICPILRQRIGVNGR